MVANWKNQFLRIELDTGAGTGTGDDLNVFHDDVDFDKPRLPLPMNSLGVFSAVKLQQP